MQEHRSNEKKGIGVARFVGTQKEFDRYVMPYITNKVQRESRSLKPRASNRCEHCGKEATLQAAHLHDRDRVTIVHRVMDDYFNGGGYDIDDLAVFEEEVMRAHEPLHDCFLFLCADCHRLYDSNGSEKNFDFEKASATAKANIASFREKTQSRGGALATPRTKRGPTLPIELIPPSKDEFKERLLAAGRAEISEYYEDGRIEKREWTLKTSGGFSASSDPIGNLRSKPQYRPAAWRAAGIVRLEVEVK